VFSAGVVEVGEKIIAALPGVLSAFVALGALIWSVLLYQKTVQSQIHADLIQHRREALFAALQVIDHVYSNEPILKNGKAPNPHDWPIQSARDADNMMRIYCSDPQTREFFIKALGLYNPDKGQPTGISIKSLDDFRLQVARELELPPPVRNEDMAWIVSLTGAK
jgi:hypothetical protein